MNCQEFVEFLIEYYEGQLSEAQSAKFEEHIALCPPCAKYLESYRQTILLEKAVFRCRQDEGPHEVPDGIVKAILEARKTQPPSSDL